MSQSNLPALNFKPFSLPFKASPTSSLLKLSTFSKMASQDVPTSGSSSSCSPISAFKELSLSPFTPDPSYTNKLVGDDIKSAAIKLKGKDRWAFLSAETEEPTGVISPFKDDLDHSRLSNRFDEYMYWRVEEFFDVEGLDIVVPSNEDANAQAARRLMVARAVSEDRGISYETDPDFGGDQDGGLLNLRKNISCSTLAKRRASFGNHSLDHSSTEENHQPKKIAARDYADVLEIPEESQVFSDTSRSSFMLSPTKNRCNLSAHVQDLFPKRGSLLDSPDFQRSNSKNCSEILSSTFVLSPTHPQGLQKHSSTVKSFELALKPVPFLNPQFELKTASILDENNNKLLSCMVKKTRGFEEKENIPKPIFEIASFAEILSDESDTSIMESPVA